MICLFGWLAGSDFVQNCSFTDRFVVQCSCWSNNFRHVTVDQILLRWFARRDRLIIVPPCQERSSARVDLKAGRHKSMLHQQHSQLGSCGYAGLDMHRRPRRTGGCISRLRDSCSCLLHTPIKPRGNTAYELFSIPKYWAVGSCTSIRRVLQH
jgi:hypothetical protein